MKLYTYFIVYNYYNDKEQGVGNCTVDNTKKISSMNDINSIENMLNNKYNHDRVIVTNWKMI